MKKSILLKSMAVLSLLFVFTACSKYEEGSKFTILTKKQRMVNTWTLSSFTVNGNSQTISGTITWDLQKDGTAVITWSSGGASLSDTGSWDFGNDKADLVMTDSNGAVETYEIVQLKNKDLKVRQTEGSNVFIWTFTGE